MLSLLSEIHMKAFDLLKDLPPTKNMPPIAPTIIPLVFF